MLAAFLSLRVSVSRRADWRVARGEAVVLGVAARVPLAAAGHAAAVEPDTARAIAVDALHVLGAGIWVGGLLPLALLLKQASTEAGADARPYAVLAARSFSRAALGVILLLAITGTTLAVTHVGNVAGIAMRAWRLPLAMVALALLGAGAGLALPPLAIDAYPTTYLRPSVPYQAGAITVGAALYQANCAGCHGPRGAGDGPDGRGLPRSPADLRAPHTAQHTAGDLFWWISHGIAGSGMPGFDSRLGEEQRWELINFLRALSAGYGARGMGPAIGRDRRWLLAPDFTFPAGPTAAPTLQGH